jgi:hypothetical protein
MSIVLVLVQSIRLNDWASGRRSRALGWGYGRYGAASQLKSVQFLTSISLPAPVSIRRLCGCSGEYSEVTEDVDGGQRHRRVWHTASVVQDDLGSCLDVTRSYGI